MKKFIKDWWPLLLIAGWWLWNRKQRSGKYYAGSNNPIPTMPSQQRLIKDYIRQLEKAGYTHSDISCPLCGSALYTKVAETPYDPESMMLSGYLLRACTNPSCENFDHSFVLDY